MTTTRRIAAEIYRSEVSRARDPLEYLEAGQAKTISAPAISRPDVAEEVPRDEPFLDDHIGDGVDLGAMKPLYVGDAKGGSYYIFPAGSGFTSTATVKVAPRHGGSLQDVTFSPEIVLAYESRLGFDGALPEFAEDPGRSFDGISDRRRRRALYIVPPNPSAHRIFQIDAIRKYAWPQRTPGVKLKPAPQDGVTVSSEEEFFETDATVTRYEYAAPSTGAATLRETARQPLRPILSDLTAALSTPGFPVRDTPFPYEAPSGGSQSRIRTGHLSQVVLSSQPTAVFVLTEEGVVVRVK